MKRDLIKNIKCSIKEINSAITKITNDAQLNKIAGPVTAELSNVLNKKRIKVQAYHGRSFIGNHCSKYLRETVYTAFSESVIMKAESLTEDEAILKKARHIAKKFKKLNELFSNVHSAVSHGSYIPEDDHDDIDSVVKKYMKYFRSKFDPE